MHRRILYLTAVLCMVLLLTGCGEPPHETEEAEAYIEKEIGITSYKIIEEPGNSAPRIWQVKLTDGSGQIFHVLDAISYGMFSSSYYLTDDYAEVMSAYEGTEYAQTLGLEVESETDPDSGMLTTTFVGEYANRESLNDLVSVVKKLGKYLQHCDHPCTFNVELQFMHPLRDVPEAAFIRDDADLRRSSVSGLSPADQKEAIRNMVIMSRSLQYRDVLADFTEEECREHIAAGSSCIGICHGDPERDSYTYYEDLCGAIYGGTISFPTFYEILIREGYSVEGESSHYWFTGIDGSECEFFYDYESGRDGCYYTRDGVLQEERSCMAHLYPTEIRNLTGLSLTVWKMGYQPNDGVYAQNGHLYSIDTIYLDGEKMTYDTQREGKFLNTTADYKELRYWMDKNTYLMTVDIGLTADNMSYPVIWREWAVAMGGSYRHAGATLIDRIRMRNFNCYKSSWQVHGDQYILLSSFKDNRVEKLMLMKNGKKVDLDYLSWGDDMYSGPSFCVAVTVDDFAALMGLSYEIDETEGSIYFTSPR